MSTRFEVSAGGVVWRREPSGLEVALIATNGGERWALPKGLVNRGESVEQAAVREVREETGLEAEILEALEPLEYWFWWGPAGKKVRHHKKVYFFVMAYCSGDTSQHDHEVDDARWFAAAEAVDKLSYRSERELVAKALERAEDLLA